MTVVFQGNIPCVVCGEIKGSIVSSYDHPDAYEQLVEVSADGYWRHWISCKRCGLLRSEFSRDSQILHSIYEEKYRSVNSGLRSSTVEELFLRISAIPPEESETHFRVDWLLNALNVLQRSNMITLSSTPTLLDVGGASGVFAHAMKEKGFQTAVLDPSVDGQFIEKYGVQYQQGYFGQTSLTQEYDVLSFLYVLEHLDDPGEILDVAKACLSQQGLLFFELPDASVVNFGERDHDAYNSCHLWLFGAYQITNLLQKHGFSVVALQRYITVRGYPSMMVLAGHIETFDDY